jgi:hypothetical protein
MNTFRRSHHLALAFGLLSALLAFGCEHSGGDGPKTERKVVQPPGGGHTATEIDRKTFSLSLPAGWTEDTKDDMHDPDSFVFFENPESCLFTVIIGKKSAGASVDELLEGQKEAFEKKLTGATTTEVDTWANYKVKGFRIEGKAQGISQTRALIYGFENGDNVCIITESATPGDFDTYAAEFETIRQSFKLK